MVLSSFFFLYSFSRRWLVRFKITPSPLLLGNAKTNHTSAGMASYCCSSSSSVAVSAPKRKRERKYWTDNESRILKEYIERNGEGKWEKVAINTGLREKGKSGDSCRRHWLNQLKPEIKKGPFTAEEDAKIIHLHNKYDGGNKKWSDFATHLPGRTDNQIKNHWNTKLSKDVGEELLLEYSSNAP